GTVPEFRRGRRSRELRGDPARACLSRGRVDLHAPRARYPGPREDRRERGYHRTRDRRGLHARIHQGVEAADEGEAQYRGETRAVIAVTNPNRFHAEERPKSQSMATPFIRDGRFAHSSAAVNYQAFLTIVRKPDMLPYESHLGGLIGKSSSIDLDLRILGSTPLR